MRVFTKLGIAFLLTVFATGMLWAQHSEAEIAAKMQAAKVISGQVIDADITPMSGEDMKSMSMGTDDTDVIGGTTNAYNAGPRTRGNAFYCTEDRTLVEFMGWHDVSTDPTQMWMLVYEGDAAEGNYELVSSTDITPAPVGLGWVSSGVIDFPLVAGKYYLLLASFEQACGYYAEPAIDPWPYPVAFGEAIGGAGYTWAPTSVFPPDQTQTVTAGAWVEPVLYHQQIVTEPSVTYDDDLGIQSIISPVSGTLLGMEDVTVNVKNYGVNAQTDIEVSYTLDGGTAVVETISGTLNGGETIEHTFATQVDLSAFGEYMIDVCTTLDDDNNDNNCKTATVVNADQAYCDASTTNEDEFIANVLCGTIDNSSGWQGGVADYTAISTAIGAGMSEDITITNGTPWAADAVTVWADWNDNFEFEAGEEEFVLTNDGTGAVFTGAITVPGTATAGEHRMRIRMVYSAVPEPCGNSTYGEIEDYTIMVGDPTYGNLEGTVTDADGGAAIEGATVSVDGMTETTGADGMYSFMDITTGTKTVSCSAAGYVNQTETVVVEEGMTATLDFALVEEEVPPPAGIVFEDDFEDYTAGEMLACQNPEDWTTWALDPCGADDAYVSDDVAYSGANSFNVVSGDDVVKELDEYLTSGTHTLSVMVYVPSGGDGYYNILSAFTPAPEWAFEVYFNAGGDAAVSAGATGAATFNYAFDTWIESKVVVDLNADWAEYFVDGNSIIAWQWTAGASGGGNALSIGALDFYGPNATSSTYFDDLVISSAEELAAPTDFTAEVVGGDDVEMNWVAPGGLGYIQWDAGTNTGNGIGLTNGGSFLVASRWLPSDLTPYDGNYMTSITIYPNQDPAASYVLKAWTGANAGTEILSQVVPSVTIDQFNEIALATPIMIDASQELWFGYECTHGAGTFPAGCDDGPAVQEFGDQISLDGATWTGMSAAYGLDYNWNIAGYLTASDNGKAIAVPMVKQTITPSNGSPVASGSNGTTVKMDNNATKGFIGFNVYRDGAVIAQEIGESTYTDMDLAPGTYTFEVKAVYDEGLSASAEPGPETLEIGDLVPRDHVIVEIGTGTWCQFCPGSAMGADEMHEEGLAVGIIEYHSGDNYETTESAARLAYYGITGYPTAYFDGIISVVGGNATQSMYATYLPKYQQRINTPTVFEIESYYYNTTGNDYEVYISVEMIDTYANLDNLKVFAALTESHIPEAWLGQTELNFVCRDMIPDASGSDADFSGSTTQTYTLGFSIPAAYVMANLEMVVFIQDIASTEVLQGAIAPYSPVGVQETLDNSIAIYPNPATDVVNITSGSEIRSITVYNNVGQVVAIENVESNIYRINTSDYETGIYFLQLETEEGMISKRVIIE